MKPLTSTTLLIRIKGLDNSTVEKIDFLFRVSDERHSKKIIQKVYGVDSSDTAFDEEKNAYKISFSPEETDKFPNNSTAWVDIRPILKDGTVVPVKMLKFSVSPTLFTRSDVSGS